MFALLGQTATHEVDVVKWIAVALTGIFGVATFILGVKNYRLAKANFKLNDVRAEADRRSRELSVNITTKVCTRHHRRILFITIQNTGLDLYEIGVFFRHPTSGNRDHFEIKCFGDKANPLRPGQSLLFVTRNPFPHSDSPYAQWPVKRLSVEIYSNNFKVDELTGDKIDGLAGMVKADPTLPKRMAEHKDSDTDIANWKDRRLPNSKKKPGR